MTAPAAVSLDPMLTRAQSWAVRLRELRAMLREGGDHLDAELKEWERRAHGDRWWAEFCRRAESGEALPETVWRSADAFTATDSGRHGWVARLRTYNAMRRQS